MRTLLKLMFWFVMWIPTWLLTYRLKKPGQENCMTWAIKKWDQDGGYLVVRWCRSSRHEWFKWPHFLWLPEDKHQDLQHVIPIDFTLLDKKHIPSPWFDPQERSGDDVLIPKEN